MAERNTDYGPNAVHLGAIAAAAADFGSFSTIITSIGSSAPLAKISGGLVEVHEALAVAGPDWVAASAHLSRAATMLSDGFSAVPLLSLAPLEAQLLYNVLERAYLTMPPGSAEMVQALDGDSNSKRALAKMLDIRYAFFNQMLHVRAINPGSVKRSDTEDEMPSISANAPARCASRAIALLRSASG